MRGWNGNPLWLVMMALLLVMGWVPTSALAAKMRVVTVLTDHAWLARELGGDRVQVKALLTGKENPHHVSARPSLVLEVSKANLLVSPGMELDIGYLPVLLRTSRNANIQPGAKGFVDTSVQVNKLQIPVQVTRAMGDQHPQGNPHYHTDPIAILANARSILQGLIRVDPGGASFYKKRYIAVRKLLLTKLVGETLVAVAGAGKIEILLQKYKLIPFLQKTQIGGKPIVRYLGGWMKQMLPHRGKKVLTYHRQWIYFLKRFGLHSVGEIEPKPGIPPSAQRLNRLVSLIKETKPSVIVSVDFFPAGSATFLSKKTGVPTLVIPLHTRTSGKMKGYLGLMNHLIRRFSAVM